MLVRYKIYNPWAQDWSCEVEVNEEFIILQRCEPDKVFTTLDAMKEMVLFWSGGANKLKENNGDITKTFLQQLGQQLIIFQSADDLTVEGLIDKFDNLEGWYKPDGAHGFKLVDADDMDFNTSDFSVEAL